MSALNYYQLLDIHPTATEEEIKIAFRKKILLVHIDKGQTEDSNICYQTIAAYNVLSNRNSRKKYDISLDNPTNQVFPTAGAICYDVEHQYSKQIANKIKQWESENVIVKNNNYFESFAGLFGKLLDTKSSKDESIFTCKLCMKSFLNQDHHWQNAINPYVEFLTSERENLTEYLDRNLVWFNFKPRYLPKSPQGVWDGSNWESFYCIIVKAREIVAELPYDASLEDKMELLTKVEALGNLELKLLNGNDEEFIIKCNEYFVNNDMKCLLTFTTILEEFTDLNTLINCCIDFKYLELAMFWRLYLFLTTCNNNWYELGMKIVKYDVVLAHFCFKLEYFEMEFIGDMLTINGDFAEALDFYLNSGSVDLLKKSQDHNCELYKVIHYSLRAKVLCENLAKDYSADDLEELIDTVAFLFEDPTSVYKIISSKFTEKLNALECLEIHRYFTKSMVVNDFEDLKRFLAGCHFLPNTDFDDDKYRQLNIQLARKELGKCMGTYDFENLSRILLNLNGYNISVAEEMCEQSSGPMNLLLKATMSSLKGDYMTAMTEYQNALLNSPELIYRLIPVVSHLTQDELFTHSVQNLVLTELKDYKELLEYGEYIDGSSLIFAETTPTDYGFKDMTSKVMSVDPEVMRECRQVKNEDDLPANTPQITITKNETAIEQTNTVAKDESLNKAFSYMDLIHAIPRHCQNGPIVMAASHLLKAMDETTETEVNKLVAYRNAICELGCELLQLFEETGSNVQCCTSQKTMFSILLAANQKLSGKCESITTVKKIPDSSTISDDNESILCENDGTGKATTKTNELIPPVQEQLISRYLKNVVTFPKIEPLINLPTYNCSDLQYVETIWNQFIVQYCRDKLKKSPSIEAAAALCTEIQHGRSNGLDPNEIKFKLMEALLVDKGWSFLDVEQLIVPKFCFMNTEGWISRKYISVKESPRKDAFCIHGFQINYSTLEIQFLTSAKIRLIDDNDLVDIFENGIEHFKLLAENVDESHPFKEIINQPALNSTEYLKSMIHVFNIINSFVTGSEFNRTAPFCTRDIDLDLPEHLQYFCSLLRTNEKCELELNVKQIYYEEVEDMELFIYKVGNVEIDTKRQEVSNVTKHYTEFCKYYPEFARLLELLKASCIRRKLRQMLVDYSFMIRQNGKSAEEINRLEQLCSNIRQLGIGIDNEEKDACCNWIPSEDKNTFEFNFAVDPIYGPVDDTKCKLRTLHRQPTNFSVNAQFSLPSAKRCLLEAAWWAHSDESEEAHDKTTEPAWKFVQVTQELYYNDTLVYKICQDRRALEAAPEDCQESSEDGSSEIVFALSNSLESREESTSEISSDSFSELFRQQTNIIITRCQDGSCETTSESEFDSDDEYDTSTSSTDAEDFSKDFSILFHAQDNFVIAKTSDSTEDETDDTTASFTSEITDTTSKDFSILFKQQNNFTTEVEDSEDTTSEMSTSKDFSLLFNQQNNIKTVIAGDDGELSSSCESRTTCTTSSRSTVESTNKDQQYFIQAFSNKYFSAVSREESERVAKEQVDIDDKLSLDDVSSILDENENPELKEDDDKLYYDDEFSSPESFDSVPSIPVGIYRISKPYTHPAKGPLTIKLTKDDFEFYIHGLNKYHKQNKDFSIIFPCNVRKRICMSGEKHFKVEE